MEKLRLELMSRKNGVHPSDRNDVMEDEPAAENDKIGNIDAFSKEESQAIGNAEIMQSVIAQRTRGRINNIMETGTKPSAVDPRMSAPLSTGSARTRSRTSYAQSQDGQGERVLHVPLL